MKLQNRGEISDQFDYLEVYTPNFPAEDRLSLKDAFVPLREALLARLSSTRSDCRRQWLLFSVQDLEMAFDSYDAADAVSGLKYLKSARANYLNSIERRSLKADFIVDSDGRTRSCPLANRSTARIQKLIDASLHA